MNRFDVFESGEVFCFEGEDSPDSVNAHSCHKPGVVYLNAGNAIIPEQPAPFLVNREAVGEKEKCVFDVSGSNLGLFWRETISATVCGARQHVSKFSQVL